MKLTLHERGFKLRGGRKTEAMFVLVFFVAMATSLWPNLLSSNAKSVVDGAALFLLGIWFSGRSMIWNGPEDRK